MRVALLTPLSRQANNFYNLFADLTAVAARQLDIDLDVIEGTLDPKVMAKRGRELVDAATRPDYVLMSNHVGIATELLPLFAEAGMGVLFVIEGLGGDRLVVGPKGCATYLGEIVPDDVEAGRLLAQVLVAEGRRRGMAGADGMIRVGVLCASQTRVNSLRFMGWKAFKDGDPEVIQSAFQYATLSLPGPSGQLPARVDDGEAAAALLLRTAPETQLLWCFNDAIAVSALRGAAALGRKPGTDLVIGGFDLLERALAAITEGAMHASIGGHFIDGARGLLLLDDHHAKRDLKRVDGMSPLEVVTASEAERYRRFIQSRAWCSADFTRFSARHARRAPEEISLRALVAG
jgi:hypothetical protein